MPDNKITASFILGLSVFLGLLALGYQLGDAAIRFKEYERTVTVKGLSERQVAEKFAVDSQSTLGKIKRTSQGQFSIGNRDKNNPHLKKVRVVSTIEYYLSD